VIDDRTWRDLMLDDVLAEIDRTLTVLGSQRLYHRVRASPDKPADAQFNRRITQFTHDAGLRESAQLALSRLGRTSAYQFWSLCHTDAVPLQWWYLLFPGLTLLIVASVVAVPFWPKALILLAFGLVTSMVIRAVTAWTAAGIVGPMRQLGPALAAASGLLSLGQLPEAEREAVQRDLAALRPLRTVARWTGRDPQGDNELIGSFFEYLNLFLLLDANVLLFSAATVRRHHRALQRVLEWVGDVDAALCVASLRARPQPWAVVEPAAQPGGTRIDELWHPLLADPVTNSVVLEPGHGLLITGSNMSGKSTFLRTVGVAAVLARAIGTVPARSYRGTSFRVRSSIGQKDDLLAGKSYYLAEAEAVVELLRTSSSAQPHLFLFDELFRGTNTVERLAAAEAVLGALLAPDNGAPRHCVLAATHDRELVALVAPKYLPVHFRQTVQADGLRFDYRLHPGPATTRSALALLALLGAPAQLIAGAEHRVRQLDPG
jgi:hypothetical protein